MSLITRDQVIYALRHSFVEPSVFVSSTEIPETLAPRVPHAWREMLDAPDMETARKLLRAYWQPLERELKFAIERVEEILQGFALHEFRGAPILVYMLQRDERWSPYHGNLPLDVNAIPEKFASAWKQMDARVHALYQIHNGWHYAGATSSTYAAIQHWYFLSDYYDAKQDDIAALLASTYVDFDEAVILASNSGGNNLGFQLYGERQTPDAILFGKERLKDMIDFWDELEEWICRALE